MSGTRDDDFVEEILASPVGVATLAAAEASEREGLRRFEAPADSDRDAVRRAAASVALMTPGQLLEVVLDAATQLAGPWTPGAPSSLAVAYEFAGARRVIAQAIADTFGPLLHRGAELAQQEWWHSDRTFDPPYDRKFVEFKRVYGNGEFPWGGLWTVTAPPEEIHDHLIDAWELYPGPISRWRLPVQAHARIWAINRPQDWVDLVERYPREAPGPHSGWELPGPNQHVGELGRLLSTPMQHAARAAVARHLLPDWDGVRRDYDGVHLTWAGFMTTEGRVVELADGTVTMLRYWASERMLFLRDVFEQPEPLSSPDLSGRISGCVGVSARDDSSRQGRDREVLTSLLGR